MNPAPYSPFTASASCFAVDSDYDDDPVHGEQVADDLECFYGVGGAAPVEFVDEHNQRTWVRRDDVLQLLFGTLRLPDTYLPVALRGQLVRSCRVTVALPRSIARRTPWRLIWPLLLYLGWGVG